MIILGICSGLLGAANHEAVSAGDSGWAGFFIMLLVLDIVAYWWSVMHWVSWLD